MKPLLVRELYRDPIYDGATDPTVVIADGQWWMFYTQRRATHPDPGPGVAWVHGSRVGVATSDDGVTWEYAGTLAQRPGGLTLTAGAPPDRVQHTHWAPEVIFDGHLWRMYLTEIDGVHERWEGVARRIVEYTSQDLTRWQRLGALKLASDRVIDAAVARTPDQLWRLWYKDEAQGSITQVAASADLESWELEGVAVGGRGHEGAAAFTLGDYWWLIVDEWRGMAIYRSDDARTWQRQGGVDEVILGPGTLPGVGPGHHGNVVNDGKQLWFYFFNHPDLAQGDPAARVSAIYRVKLKVRGGVLKLA